MRLVIVSDNFVTRWFAPADGDMPAARLRVRLKLSELMDAANRLGFDIVCGDSRSAPNRSIVFTAMRFDVLEKSDPVANATVAELIENAAAELQLVPDEP